ncbi:hypothetical protein KCU85_g9770, partial [Aureobasidium melanogenum]
MSASDDPLEVSLTSSEFHPASRVFLFLRTAEFIDSWDPYDDDILSVVNEAMIADPDFVKEFEIRARKIISDFFIRKMKDALVKDLTEAFSKI